MFSLQQLSLRLWAGDASASAVSQAVWCSLALGRGRGVGCGGRQAELGTVCPCRDRLGTWERPLSQLGSAVLEEKWESTRPRRKEASGDLGVGTAEANV